MTCPDDNSDALGVSCVKMHALVGDYISDFVRFRQKIYTRLPRKLINYLKVNYLRL